METLQVAMVETPDGDQNSTTSSRERGKENSSARTKARILRIAWSTFRRNEKKAAEKRLDLKLGKDDVLWSSVTPRATWSKIPPQLLNDLRNGLLHILMLSDLHYARTY